MYLKGGDDMTNLAINYATLIVAELKTFATCPRLLKRGVADCLIAWGYPELITDPAYQPVV